MRNELIQTVIDFTLFFCLVSGVVFAFCGIMMKIPF